MSHACAYNWVRICEGNMYNKGYFCEASFKSIEPEKVNSRGIQVQKISGEFFDPDQRGSETCLFGLLLDCSFERVTFSHPTGNLQHVSEQLKAIQALFTKFKEWIQVNNVEDMAFRHNCSDFLLCGPLMSMYNSTRNGDGTTREVVYKLLMPVYAQLGFKNYFQETFRHAVNINAKWPESTRKILQGNCCVNLTGKKGNPIEMDPYLESEVVYPVKVYYSGHTTVKMCEHLMGNIDLMKSVRNAYKSPDSFDVHHIGRHSEQDPFPGQLEAAWFCLSKEFFTNKKRKKTSALPVDKKGQFDGKISKKVVDVYEKGVKIIKENCKTKVYDCFPDLRYKILTE